MRRASLTSVEGSSSMRSLNRLLLTVVGNLLIYRMLCRWQKRSIPSLKPLLFLRSTSTEFRRAFTPCFASNGWRLTLDRVLCNRECVTEAVMAATDRRWRKQWRPRSPDRRRRGVLRVSQRIGLSSGCGGGSGTGAQREGRGELNEGLGGTGGAR